MTRYLGDLILYRVRFNSDPELNSDHFESLTPYSVGDEFRFTKDPVGGSSSWEVVEVIDGAEGEPDTLVIDHIVHA
jgi:hypothetical protein